MGPAAQGALSPSGRGLVYCSVPVTILLGRPEPAAPNRVSSVNHRSQRDVMELAAMKSQLKPRGTGSLTAATALATTLLVATGTTAPAQTAPAQTAESQSTQPAQSAGDCKTDAGGITLSPGFCATVFADHIGHARHLAVAANGTVYVNTWSGVYYHNDTPPPGGFLIALQDTKGVGRADKIVRFGPGLAQGDHGGTGIALYKGYVYAETNDRIVRYPLPANGIAPTAAPETVISGLPLTGDHPMHPFEIDRQGNLYVDLGSATNSCQSQNRMPKVPG